MERTERVILTNLCMIRSGLKVLVEEKVGKGAGGGVNMRGGDMGNVTH